MRYNKKYLKPISLVIILICIILFINLIISGNSTILNYLKTNSSKYIYITSITGENNEKADVYKSNSDLDSTAKDIINSINGEVESVQQNTEDGGNSIAILTNDEYCLIYISEDKEVLIQVSSRKYAYTTDKSPYNASSGTYGYYRSYYYSRGYKNDIDDFSSSNSAYKNFDGKKVDFNSLDSYNNYSSSIRQSSIKSRSSSGGGISSGK